MKALLPSSILLLSSLNVFPQSGTAIWRGYNELEERDSNGVLFSQSEQFVTKGTNLMQRDLYCFPSGDSTQSLYVTYATLGSTWFPVRKVSVNWLRDGTITTNDRPATEYDDSLVFFNAGDQGARKWTNEQGIIKMTHYAAFLAKWPTNDFVSQCPAEDDAAGVIWWFRKGPANGSAWFVGMNASIRPGDRLVVDGPLPMNEFWYHLGSDKNRGCGTNVWLSSWPAPIQISTAMTIGQYEGTIVLLVRGIPGKEYVLSQAPAVGAPMVPMAQFTMPAAGEAPVALPASGKQGFYRMEAE